MPKNRMSHVRKRDPHAKFARGVRLLFPGYFALVMATGIVSIACQTLGLRPLALLLLGVNWSAYVALCALTLIRLICFRKFLIIDFFSHQRGPGFFTLVAGTCVLGAQNVIVLNFSSAAIALWWVGVALWFVVMYAFFAGVTVRTRKPTLGRGISGAWFIASVSTQSIVVLRTVIDATAPPPEAIQLQVIAMFMIGAMLYFAIVPLIFYRLTFSSFKHAEFSPPYWINMGAVAIATLAGSLLMDRADVWPLVNPLLPFIRGLTVFFWATATWWIPFLFTLMTWRYVFKRDRFRYEPAVWSMVFPLGMYTVSTAQFQRATGYDYLWPLVDVFFVTALTAWVLAACGLGRVLYSYCWSPQLTNHRS